MALRTSEYPEINVSDLSWMLVSEELPSSTYNPVRAMLIREPCPQMLRPRQTQISQCSTVCLRHSDPHACIVGQIAFLLFYRWQVERLEPFPDLTDSSPNGWVQIKLLCSTPSSPERAINPSVLHAQAMRLRNISGLALLLRPLSSMRQSPFQPRIPQDLLDNPPPIQQDDSRHPDSFGSRELQRSFTTISLLAGFSTPSPAIRSTVQPSTWLRSQVWPELNQWMQQAPQTVHVHEFIDVMAWLRDIFLQDAVVFQLQFPSHPIFQDDLFHSDAWQMFATAVKRVAMVDAAEIR